MKRWLHHFLDGVEEYEASTERRLEVTFDIEDADQDDGTWIPVGVIKIGGVDVFVHPTTWDSDGTDVLEALALALQGEDD